MAQKIKGYSLDNPAFATPFGKPPALVIPKAPKHQRSTGNLLSILIDRPLVGIAQRSSHWGQSSVRVTDLQSSRLFHSSLSGDLLRANP